MPEVNTNDATLPGGYAPLRCVGSPGRVAESGKAPGLFGRSALVPPREWWRAAWTPGKCEFKSRPAHFLYHRDTYPPLMVLTAEVSVSTTNNIGSKARRGVMKFLKQGADRGFAESVDKVPVSSGQLQANMFSPEMQDGKIVWGVRGADHARPIEEGTDPFWPPIAPLKTWARRVTGDEDFAYYVQWKIANEGIESQPYIAPGREEQINWYRKNDAGEWIQRELD